jgi:hypothetical protein
MPWRQRQRLSLAERRLVAPSLAQFQLGEGAQGRSFTARAAAHAEETGDPEYLEAVRAFIGEEQRHSAELGRFLDREGIPRREHDAVDGIFRRLRKLGGLRVMVGVLVAAEAVSMAYYRALHDVTGSPLLRALCRQILRDEAQHLRFQGYSLARTGYGWVDAQIHRALVMMAALVVYGGHRELLRAAGRTARSFLQEVLRAHAIVARAAGQPGQYSRSFLMPGSGTG